MLLCPAELQWPQASLRGLHPMVRPDQGAQQGSPVTLFRDLWPLQAENGNLT